MAEETPPHDPTVSPSSTTEAAIASGRLEFREGDTIRRRAARGTIITGVFMAGVQALGLLKGFVIAAFIPASDYGVWGLLIITLGTLLWLGKLGFDDRYVQQDDDDQEQAFRKAFTMQSLLVVAFMGLVLVAMPLFALAYGNWDILLPGYALGLLGMPPLALQTPLWVWYRRMEFRKERLLQSIDPLTGFVLTVALAIAGLGYWALVIGTIVSSWAAALAAVRSSPYKLRFHWEKGMWRDYTGFSWPLFVGSVNGILIAQVPILVAERSLGTAAVGAITLAATISLYTSRMDDVLSHALYTTICAAKDRRDLLLESFSKSNRMALLWAAPIGAGLALFAAPLVHYVLGDRWEPAIFVLQIMALTAAVNQIGFNWGAFYRARGETRPLAVASFIMLFATLAVAVPLLLEEGLRGYAVGMGIATLVVLVVRLRYLSRLFPAYDMLGHVARAVAPTALAAGIVLLARALGAPDTPSWAAAEVVAFGVTVVAATALAERALVREFVGYLRRNPEPAAAATV